MDYRHVVIRQPAHLKTKHKNLCLVNADGETIIPIEDLASVIIETQRVTFSASILYELSKQCPVFICDKSHLPKSILLPINTYSRQLTRINEQISIKKPLKKNLWSCIIKNKILNQAKCLELVGKDNSKLISISKQIKSGDPTNTEAIAAHYYFHTLFGYKFTRSLNNTWNSSLNYGYSIIRGFIARTITSHGFQPALGLFHHNQFNQFNLVDDMIEPFRPFIDYYIAKNIGKNENFSSEIKNNLINIMTSPIFIKNKNYQLSYSINIMIESFVSAIKYKNSKYLLLPSFPNSIKNNLWE